MTRRHAMTLLEVLLAAAMLAMIAAALTGLGRTAVVIEEGRSIDVDPETLAERYRELRLATPNTLEEILLPGEQLARYESKPITPDQPISGEWLIVESDAGLVIRWLPAAEEDEGRAP